MNSWKKWERKIILASHNISEEEEDDDKDLLPHPHRPEDLGKKKIGEMDGIKKTYFYTIQDINIRWMKK